MKISIFKNTKATAPAGEIEFSEYLTGIKDGLWMDQIVEYKAGRIEKNMLPAVTPSGTFRERRAAANLTKHSGFINIDIDQKENHRDLLEARSDVFADPYIYAGHRSVSGTGLSLYVKIDPAKHKEAFLCLERYFANQYEIIIDKACKDVSRLRFVAYDAEMHTNEKAAKWNDYETEKERKELAVTYIHTDDDIDMIIQQVRNRALDIAPSYHDWLRLGFAIATKYGAAGADKFHALSQYNSAYTYEATEKQYKHCLTSNGSGITINFLFYLAKQNGLEIITPRTQTIAQAAKFNKKKVGKSGGHATPEAAKAAAAEYIEWSTGVTKEEAAPIINQIFNTNDKQIPESTEDKTAQLFLFIDEQKLRYNEVTHHVEINGRNLEDMDVNSIYINAVNIFGEKVSKNLIFDYIHSEATPRFNPFVEFYNKHNHIKPAGRIKAVTDTITGTMTNNEGSRVRNYNEYFIRKWLLSVIASSLGTYSLLILVLSGKQVTGKTKWIRGLLPPELQRYYAESKLDEGKDDDILMTNKLIICDDEFGGKSKKEVKKLKEKSSRDSFTIRPPYGRTALELKRYAVLCGTTNDTEIINDLTGNRRIIPVNVESVDFEKYNAIDKTELWMELYHEYKATGDDWMLTAHDINTLKEYTTDYKATSTEEDLIDLYFQPADYNNTERHTATDIKVTIEARSGIKYQRVEAIGILLRSKGYKQVKSKTGQRFYIIDKISQEHTPPNF